MTSLCGFTEVHSTRAHQTGDVLSDMDENDPFALLEEALEEERRKELQPRGVQPIVTRLRNGDYHVCHREFCEFATLDEDRQLICAATGILVGQDFVRDHDASWTGRSTTSGDPDVIGGTPQGGWKPRKDAFAESQRAFAASKGMSAAEVVYQESAKEKKAREARAVAKRGATCVDEAADEAAADAKRERSLKRTREGREITEKLKLEAAAIMEKLTQPISGVVVAAAEEPAAKPDIRLQSYEFVRCIMLRRFIASCQKGDDYLSMSRLNDVSVAANEFARQQRLTAKATTTTAPVRQVFSGETKSKTAGLVVALWRAACSTAYLAEVRRGTDSFRPFVCGCLYALKRGLSIEVLNNLEIIPSIPKLSAQLPTLRSADASTAARQLQSSSHRGLCTLHRAISSFADTDPSTEAYAEARLAFEAAARVAQQLKEFCR